MKLSNQALKKVDDTPGLKNQLAAAFKKSEATVRRWIKSNNIMLTHEISISLIEKETGLTRDKIIRK